MLNPEVALLERFYGKTKGDYVVLELYDDEAAVKVHKENLKKNFPPSLSLTLAGAPKVDVFQVVVSRNEPATAQHNDDLTHQDALSSTLAKGPLPTQGREGDACCCCEARGRGG